MKRLTFLSVVLALGLVLGLHGMTVTVGNPTGYTTDFPISTVGRYNYTQQIYTRGQIFHQGVITRIRFYHDASYDGCMLNSDDWVIYMGHTDRSSFASKTDWVPFANLTQVFAGNVQNLFPPCGQWMEIVLDTPFEYDNTRNLVVAVHEYTPYTGTFLYWGSFNSGANRGLAINSVNNTINPDPAHPFEANIIRSTLASIQLVFPDTQAPLAPTLLNPGNGASVTNGQTLDWILPEGSADVTGYDVYIDGVLVSENQTARSYQMRGLEPGNHTWYVVAKNDLGSSAASETRSFVTLPGVTIGNGNIDSYIPINVAHSYNYSQTIYLQSEIDIDNRRIESISYYWNGEVAPENSGDWVIYMGHTNKTQFANNSDWIPTTQMVQVFDGYVDIPAEPGWVEIQLDNPFLYNNTDNLVIAVDENTPGGDSQEYTVRYFSNTYLIHQLRSIYYCGPHYVNADPAAPGAGFVETVHPNIRLRFGEIPTEPVFHLTLNALDFGLLLNGESSQPQNVVAFNAGGGTLNLNLSAVSIIGPNAAEFSFDPTNLPAALGPGQTVQIPVTVTGVSTGQISATLRLVYNGENYDVQLSAEIAPTGTIRIGEGTQGRPYPFQARAPEEVSATIYTVDQIGTVGLLDMLAWNCLSTSDAVIPYKIWAQNTNANTFTVEYWDDMASGMTLVKEGVYTPNTLGWNSFQLDTPFAYTGGNLIIAVECNRGEQPQDERQLFAYTNVGPGRHQSWVENPNSPPSRGFLSNHVANIMMHMVANLDNDLSAVDISGDFIPKVGETSNYTVRLRNSGSNLQDNYQVKLMGLNNVELAVVNGIPIESGATAEVVIPWTPTGAGQFGIYGKVVSAADEYGANNQTGLMQVTVLPAGSQTTTVGAGDKLAGYPLGFDNQGYAYECIYLDDELDFVTGTITSIALYNRFSNAIDDANIQIFLGSTNQDNLRAGFIPASELSLVYDGTIDFPAGENAVYVPLFTPYVHTGGNLVALFNRPQSTQWNLYTINNFKCQTAGYDRARYSPNYYQNLDLNNLPNKYTTGILPQATFLYTADVYNNELAALDITGNSLPTVGEVANYTVRIRNYGQQTQNNYQVKLMGANETELAVVSGPSIESGATAEVVIPWTPDTMGTIDIYAKVVFADDEFAQNNQTNRLKLRIQPQGYATVTIGNGNINASCPMDFFDRTSLHETIYYDYELGFSAGTITSIELYNQFFDNLPNAPTRIYLGTTNRTNLGAGFIPASQLTLVYDGLVDYPAGSNTIHIQLQNPYQYTGGNLVVMFHRPFEQNMFSFDNKFKSQQIGYDRARFTSGRRDAIDPSNPGDGMISGIFPKTTFFFMDESPENDLMALSINGNTAAAVGVAAPYVVRVKNNGSQTQDNYRVKLMGPDETELAYVYGPPLSCNQTEEVTVFWTPQETGSYAIYGKVELDGDENIANDDTANLELTVYPPGATDVFAEEIALGMYIHWSAPASDAPRSVAAFDDIGNLSALSHAGKSNRDLAGYLVYRLQHHQMEDENSWTSLTSQPTTTLDIVDSEWQTVSPGSYYWAVKAVYAGGAVSLPSFSNLIWRGSVGTVAGTVTQTDGTPIAGATVTDGYTSATTDASGAYSLVLWMGPQTITASAPGFISQTVQDVIVIVYNTIILDFVLERETSDDDPQNPVVATALNGNYPNPFNPETTISYSVKEAGRVKLEIYNIKGQLVRTLVDADHAAGHYKQVFNSKDNRGRSISSGVYLLRMSAPGYQKTSKMILMQ